jgi:hypothetical protein
VRFEDSDRRASEDEPHLAQYLVDRVCGRAAGVYEDECLHTAPSDKYFIGSLRPSPPAPGAEELPAPGFLGELLTKLAPVAFGAEFRLRPICSDVQVRVRLDWACYFRVFPTLEEQREHQRHAGGVSEATLDEPPDRATVAAGPSRTREDDGDDPAEEVSTASAEPPGSSSRTGSRRRPTDSLFQKYRKVRCSAEGDVGLRGSGPSPDSWVCDCHDVQAAVELELARIRDSILADPEHLRIGENAETKLRVPVDALESAATYQAFKAAFPTPVLPAWQWAIVGYLRRGEDEGDLILLIEATNVSRIDRRAWHSEGFFFDVRAQLSFDGADVLPFELEMAPQSFRYDRRLWARGFNCAIVKQPLQGEGFAFGTTNVPFYVQRRYSTNTQPAAPFDELVSDPAPVLRRILAGMREYDHRWSAERIKYAEAEEGWEARHGQEYDRDHQLFTADVERFESGCQLLEEDADVRLAFQLTNRAFALNGQKTAWRLFQIVFIVSQIRSIHALRAGSDAALADRSLVDIIYFPTGGGKTEAYLGVVVFHCFFDRLRGKTAGVTTWTRFPLRLLTLQQTQRVADVVGAAELIRGSHPDSRLSGVGVDGFAVGYYVGDEATPNELTPPMRGQAPDPNWSTACDAVARQRWKKIVKCPACGTSTVRVDFDRHAARLSHRCTNSACRFAGGMIPVHVVDNEVYRFLPCVIVGTIDKLASLGLQRKLSLILGEVTGRCSEHGYYNAKCCQKECSDLKRLHPGKPVGISGPTLFIQDELHLLKEGLGTFDSHYETFLQALLRSFGHREPVKIIASSATIEAFDRQVLHLYGRSARIFPGQGPRLGESFYAHTSDHAQRLFVGVLPHNKTILNAALELLQYFHEEIGVLERAPSTSHAPFTSDISPGTSQWRRLLDPYLTSLAYFSATRELSSVRTDLEAHVNTELAQAGCSPLRIAELSGGTSTDEVTRILELLEMPGPGISVTPNAVLATSMISHGVDVDRLNCMFFYGMPKQNAEYIQASSRVGRSHVGIVFTCLKPARERDQSHFAYFEKYHEFLGQLVEPVAINRWSKFSIQRTIPGLFMAVLLQRIANRSEHDSPGRFYMVDFVKKLISSGAIEVADFLPLLSEAYMPQTSVGRGLAGLQAEIGVRVRQFLDQILGAGGHATFVSNALIPPPMRNLRQVDEQIAVELDGNGGMWASRGGR